MRYSKFLIIFLIAFLPAKLFAQDITGLWKGTLYNDTTKKFYRYEIGISEEKGKLSGFSHTFFLVDDKEFYGVKKIKIKKADGKIIIEDAGLIANNYPEAPAKGVKQLNILTLEIKDSIMTLTGPFTTNRTKEYSALTGTISLQRKNDFWQSALVPHLQELKLANELSFVKKENDRVKQEEDKIAAEKEMAIKNEKAVADAELAKNEETIRSKSKNTEAPKEIAANTKASSKEISPATKDVAANTNPVKTETKKEEKQKEPTSTTAPKEIVSTTNASTKEIKQNESTPVATSKEIAANTTPAKEESLKEIKRNESTLQKRPANEQTKEVAVREIKKLVPVKSNAPAAEVANRTNVVQQTVYFTSDSLQISLYDNGEVDGDTVSVLMNGQVIMAKERLSTNAVRKTIFAPANADSIELIMYAENLGTIAPNTGLLVVRDGKSIYEIRFSGDLNKNASIILRRRKT